MLKLSAKRVKLAYDSYWKNHGISEELYIKSHDVIVRALEGNRYLTRQEIGEKLNQSGVIVGDDLVKYLLGRAEVDGIVCNGVDNGSKRTYALLDERVPPMKELHKEEALAKLAIKYFRSHSPTGFYLVVGIVYNRSQTGGRVDRFGTDHGKNRRDGLVNS